MIIRSGYCTWRHLYFKRNQHINAKAEMQCSEHFKHKDREEQHEDTMTAFLWGKHQVMALQSSQEKGKDDQQCHQAWFVLINTEKLQITRSVDNLWRSEDGCIWAHINGKELVPWDQGSKTSHRNGFTPNASFVSSSGQQALHKSCDESLPRYPSGLLWYDIRIRHSLAGLWIDSLLFYSMIPPLGLAMP